VNEEFFQSVGNIREVSMDMLKSVRAVKGENYARVVHAIILCDQVDGVLDVFEQGADEATKPVAEYLHTAGGNMIGRIMDYLIRASSLSEAQVKEAFEDANRIQQNTYNLVSRAHDLADQGRVMGE